LNDWCLTPTLAVFQLFRGVMIRIFSNTQCNVMIQRQILFVRPVFWTTTITDSVYIREKIPRSTDKYKHKMKPGKPYR